MSEIGGTKPDFSKYHWNDGGTPEPQSEPNESKKDAGFPFQDIPPADEENWWRDFGSQLLNYLGTTHIREFDYLNEAIAATNPPDVFRVRAPAAGINDRAGSVFNVQGYQGAVPITDSCTDGYQYYYLQGTWLNAANTLTGGYIWQAWPRNPFAGNAICCDCDGQYIVVCYPYNPTPYDTFLLDASGGVQASWNIGTSTPNTDVVDVAINGKYLAALRQMAGTPIGAAIWVYDISSLPATLVGTTPTYTTGGAITNAGQIVIDDYYAHAVWNDYYLKCQLSAPVATISSIVSTSVFTASTPFNAVTTDGLGVWIGTNRSALIAGGNADVLVVERPTNTILDTKDYTIDVQDICCDDHYIIFSRTTPSVLLGICEKINTKYVHGTISGRRVFGHSCDGISFFGSDGANNITRNWMGNPTRLFMRCQGTDYSRKPFYNAAIPMTDEA